MGIDIFLNWKGQTRKDRRIQAAAASQMSRTSGQLGYLREAYAGEPALHFNLPPGYESRGDLTNIPTPPESDKELYTGPINMINGQETCTLPYATKCLVTEVFDLEHAHKRRRPTVQIPAQVLMERLPNAIKTHIEKEKDLYDRTLTEDAPTAQAYWEFVALVTALEIKGKKPKVIGDY